VCAGPLPVGHRTEVVSLRTCECSSGLSTWEVSPDTVVDRSGEPPVSGAKTHAREPSFALSGHRFRIGRRLARCPIRARFLPNRLDRSEPRRSAEGAPASFRTFAGSPRGGTHRTTFTALRDYWSFAVLAAGCRRSGEHHCPLIKFDALPLRLQGVGIESASALFARGSPPKE